MSNMTKSGEIADRTRDAYSFDAYGVTEWRRAIRKLLDKGFSEVEVEAIMRSKWTRWARDAKSTHNGTARDLIEWVDAHANKSRDCMVADLLD